MAKKNDDREKELKAIANTERGKELIKLISWGLVDKQATARPMDTEGSTFSEIFARRIKVDGGTEALLKHLRDLSKKFVARSVERLKEPAEAIGNWAIGLAALPNAEITAENSLYSFKMKEGDAMREAAKSYVYLLSNTKDDYLWYQTDKAQKKGSKRDKKLIFDDPTGFGAQLEEAWKSSDSITMGVSPKIVARDNDGRCAKAVEFFAKAALFFDEKDLRQAGEMYRNLIGELPEDENRRIFNFDPGMVLDVIQGRVWGRLALAVRDWRSEIVKARENGAEDLQLLLSTAANKIAALPAELTETVNPDTSVEGESTSEAEDVATA